MVNALVVCALSYVHSQP